MDDGFGKEQKRKTQNARDKMELCNDHRQRTRSQTKTPVVYAAKKKNMEKLNHQRRVPSQASRRVIN